MARCFECGQPLIANAHPEHKCKSCNGPLTLATELENQLCGMCGPGSTKWQAEQEKTLAEVLPANHNNDDNNNAA